MSAREWFETISGVSVAFPIGIEHRMNFTRMFGFAEKYNECLSSQPITLSECVLRARTFTAVDLVDDDNERISK